MNDQQPSWRQNGLTILCGLSMGCADVVPGVSGGTVALILGIYDRLVTAISRFDRTLWGHMRRRQWREAAAYVDLRFLFLLAGGLGTGVVAMSLIVNRLLADGFTRAITFAAFSGMILASSWLVAWMIRPTTRQLPVCVVLGLVGVVIAWWASALPKAIDPAPPSLPWLFVCGSIAICAMILPGISGALMLLVLGVYAHLTDVPGMLLKGEAPLHGLSMLVAFGGGCAVGLLSFSKILKWLLARHHALTMSLLCGFMLGALRKLWPFQIDLTPDEHKFKHKEFALAWPDVWDAQVACVLLVAAGAMVAVLVIDRQVRNSVARATTHEDGHA